MILKVVVFPAPLGPSRANISPVPTPKDTLSTTVFPPNAFEMPRTRSESCDAETAFASTSTSGAAAMITAGACIALFQRFRMLRSPRGSRVPESHDTRMANRMNPYTMRYNMGPPYRPKPPNEAVVTGLDPSHRRANRFKETKAARN